MCSFGFSSSISNKKVQLKILKRKKAPRSFLLYDMSGKPIVFFWAKNETELDTRKDYINSLDVEIGELCFVSDVIIRFKKADLGTTMKKLKEIVRDESRFDNELILYNISRTIGDLYTPIQSFSAICPDTEDLSNDVAKLAHISPIFFSKEKSSQASHFLRWEIESINNGTVADISEELEVKLKIEELPGFAPIAFEGGTMLTLRFIYAPFKTPSHLSRRIVFRENETTPIIKNIRLLQNPAMGKQTYPQEIELEIQGSIMINEKKKEYSICEKKPVASNLICGNLINQPPFVILLFGESMAGKTSLLNTIAVAMSQKKGAIVIRDYQVSKKKVLTNITLPMNFLFCPFFSIKLMSF